jgi:pimeloyl-ACP methyl ester carboxylesterase
VAELVDALDSKSSSARSAGSIPARGTNRASALQAPIGHPPFGLWFSASEKVNSSITFRCYWSGMKHETLMLATGETTRMSDSGGNRPALVLIHGLANSLEIWDRVCDRLARSFRVITFDLPGFGRASRPDAAYDGLFFATQLRAFLDALGLEGPILVGNSLGASVILHLSALAPGRIEKAVLAAPGGFGRKTNLTMRLPALPIIGGWLGRPTPYNNKLTLRLAIHDRANVTSELVALTNRYASIPGSSISFVRTLKAGVGLFGSRDRNAIEQIARQFAAPALIVWGQQDRVFPVAQAECAANLLPRSEMLLVDQCGHYPQWEHPDLFAEAIERFCG